MAVTLCKHGIKAEDKTTRVKYLNAVKKEIFRKSIHMCSAFLPFFFSKNKNLILILLSIVLVIYIIAEFLRLKGISVPIISKVTSAAARSRDEGKFVLGPVTLALGIIITEICFEPVPASIGIYALALGDGLASLSGKLFGHVTIPFTGGKTVAGSLTCFLAIFLSSYFVSRDPLFAVFIGICGMIMEILPLKNFDNLVIPVLTAFLSQLYFHR